MEATDSSSHEEFILSTPTLVVLEGDQTGQELLLEALRVLDRSVIDIELAFEHYDLSLEKRRETQNQIVLDAAEAMKKHRLGLKAATITPEQKGDVGSPNRILRERIDGKVIVRTGRKLPRVRPVAGITAPISVVRMAVGDAYGAKEWREGEGADEVAHRTETISRAVCRYVSDFAFVHARKMRAVVFGGPKYTVSPVYEGMLKEEMDAAAARHPDVGYDPQLIDATYALLLSNAGDHPLVIPSLNRDGDCLSDMIMQLFGSIAGAESVLLAFDQPDGFAPSVVMAEAPHGTAPRLQGKNVANPLAMILAAAAVLSYIDDKRAANASRAIYEAALEGLHSGIATADLGGHASTTEFTDAVIEGVRRKLDVWSTL
jgi:isocitrate/isopropylmalate dehydrogenase